MQVCAIGQRAVPVKRKFNLRRCLSQNAKRSEVVWVFRYGIRFRKFTLDHQLAHCKMHNSIHTPLVPEWMMALRYSAAGLVQNLLSAIEHSDWRGLGFVLAIKALYVSARALRIVAQSHVLQEHFQENSITNIGICMASV